MTAERQAGDPVATLPVAYHLLWRRELSCDLSVLLGETSMTWRPLERSRR